MSFKKFLNLKCEANKSIVAILYIKNKTNENKHWQSLSYYEKNEIVGGVSNYIITKKKYAYVYKK